MHANSNFGSTSCPLISRHTISEASGLLYIFKVVVAIGTRLDIAAARLQIDIRLMGWA
jgi:hypothetical protein